MLRRTYATAEGRSTGCFAGASAINATPITNDYVPVLTPHLPEKEGDPVSERVDVMDKKALNRRLARSYLVELMDRARIVSGRQTQCRRRAADWLRWLGSRLRGSGTQIRTGKHLRAAEPTRAPLQAAHVALKWAYGKRPERVPTR